MKGLRLLSVLLGVLASSCGGDETGTSPGAGGQGGTVTPQQAPVITALHPATQVGGVAFTMDVSGEAFLDGDVVTVDGASWPTVMLDELTLQAEVPARARGIYPVRVLRDALASNALELTITNTPPRLVDPGDQQLGEDESLELAIEVSDFDGDDLRVLATGLPPGASWDELDRRLQFTPDFIQGGQGWTVQLFARDGEAEVETSFTIDVADTITPPAPQITSTDDQSDHLRLTLSQTTDDYLDSPGYAGRSLTARVVIPKSATATEPRPVRVFLHGLGGSPYTGGSGEQFRIYPHDPDNTYWWGYSDQLPGGQVTSGTVPNYTQRRVLHLLEWVVDNYPGADAEQVYVTGGSMGGAGAAALGLLYARHFAYVHATIGQKIPRNHRPARLAQLSTWWGSPEDNLPDAFGMGHWDRGDLTRALLEHPEARQQLIFTKHGKDDPTIHFGATVMASPLTGLSFYEVLQAEQIGHYVVWDEGGHGPADPVMGADWWDDDWSLVFDATTFLRRNLAFVAFSQSSFDDDPGDGTGNGNQTWSDSSGYAGTVSVAGDTGWTGDLAGARNRFLRWDATAIVDELDRFEVPLLLASGNGGPAPASGYPTTGDQLPAAPPVVASVTVRRSQRFQCRPGELLRYTYGSVDGMAAAGSDGAVTVPALPVTGSPELLVIERAPASDP